MNNLAPFCMVKPCALGKRYTRYDQPLLVHSKGC